MIIYVILRSLYTRGTSYTTEISMIIRYANMVFFAIIMLYVIFSKKFDNEVKKQIATIKEDEEKFLRDVDWKQ